jgi:nucleotide-binding universal stress UspA family protein
MSALYHHLLVPTDFSLCADNAVQYALSLAEKTKAKVSFLHAYHVPMMTDMNGLVYPTGSMLDTLIEESEVKLKELVTRSQKKYPQLKLEALHQEGFLTDVVRETCESKKIDLIVIGTQGASGWEEIVLGSNAALVMESTSCPILVVPQKALYKDFQKILFASDFEFEDLEALTRLQQLAALFEAKLQVVHVSKDPASEEDMLDWLQELSQERFSVKGITFKNIEENESTMHTLHDYLLTEGIDLVAMDSTNKSFFKKIFQGSMTEKMAYHTHIPFMAFHIKNGK